MSSAPTDWEQKYRAGDTPWNKGAPSPGLVDFLENHPAVLRGRVAVPGCGFGHDACAWARAGLEATGFDLAESAVRLARENAPADVRVEFKQSDFLADSPGRPFHWLFEHTLFCAIQPDRRQDYVEAARRWLAPGGQYLAVNYFLPLEEAGPPFGVDRAEIHRRFAPHFELLGEWIPRSYPNRVGLERMYWWRKK